MKNKALKSVVCVKVHSPNLECSLFVEKMNMLKKKRALSSDYSSVQRYFFTYRYVATLRRMTFFVGAEL